MTSDNATTARWWCELRDVDGDLGRADTDGETVDEATSDEHTNVLRGARDDGTDHPDNATDLDRATTTKLVGQVTGDKGTDEGTTRHAITMSGG